VEKKKKEKKKQENYANPNYNFGAIPLIPNYANKTSLARDLAYSAHTRAMLANISCGTWL